MLSRKLSFNYSKTPIKISALEPLIGASGWLAATALTFASFETQDTVLLTAFAEDGRVLDADLCSRLFSLPANVQSDREKSVAIPVEAYETLRELEERAETDWVQQLETKNAGWLLQETQKLNSWADDRVRSAEQDIKDTKTRIQELNRESRKTTNPAAQLAIQKELNELTRIQKKLRQQIYSVEDDIEHQRDTLIKQIEARMKNQLTTNRLFTIRWTLQ